MEFCSNDLYPRGEDNVSEILNHFFDKVCSEIVNNNNVESDRYHYSLFLYSVHLPIVLLIVDSDNSNCGLFPLTITVWQLWGNLRKFVKTVDISKNGLQKILKS